VAKLLDKICGVLAVVAALLLLFITFSIGYSIFTRQLKLPTPVWVVQFNEYSLLWVTFLGTAWVLSQEKHVSIQLVTERLSARMQRVLSLVHNLVGLGLCGAFCWFGWFTTWDHYVRKVIDAGSVDFPKAFVLAVIPLGFLLLALQFLHKFIADLRLLKEGKVFNASGGSHSKREC
jgi:TRAP-type C4-dicarboxylate transport system permease small subunit